MIRKKKNISCHKYLFSEFSNQNLISKEEIFWQVETQLIPQFAVDHCI